jgi:hypothetical protein
MKRKQRRKKDRPIESLTSKIVVLGFIFFDRLTALTAIQFRAELRDKYSFPPLSPEIGGQGSTYSGLQFE